MSRYRRGLQIGRRQVLKKGLGWGAGLSLAPTLAWGQVDPPSMRPKEGDLFVDVNDSSLTPLTPDDIPAESRQTMAWAMDPTDRTVRSGSRLNRVLLLRIDTEKLSPETRALAADGVVAYTAICTHTGCEVTDWLADEQLLFCPCHLSKFDPREGARVVEGPAPRTLPALPLMIVDGKLAVAKPFTSRVGFETA
jgi:rieske iron-sulfur protein